MSYTLLLSSGIRETQEYIRDKGLTFRTVKHATSAEAVRGMRPRRIIQLPSFEERPDRHAIRGALRHLMNARHAPADLRIEVDETWVRPHLRPEPAEPAGAEEIPGQVSLEEALADSNALEDCPHDQAHSLFHMMACEDSEAQDKPKRPEPKPAAKPKRRRAGQPADPTPPKQLDTTSFFAGMN